MIMGLVAGLALVLLGASLAVSAEEQSKISELQKAVEEFKARTRELGMRPDSPVRARRSPASRAKWHGRLFHNLRNDFLDAVPKEVRQRGGDRRHLRRGQFGFNVSGPLVIPKLYDGGNRTFFSLTYEGMREKMGRSWLRTIPTMEERTGDWSHVVDQAGNPLPIYDPLTTAANPNFDPGQSVSRENLQYLRQPFPGNVIPKDRLDPAAQRALSFYPAPNSDAGPFFRNNFFILANEPSEADGINGRIDHSISERQRLGFSFNISDGLDGAAPWFPNLANPGAISRMRRNREGSLEHVFTVSPSTINTFRFQASTSASENETELDDDGRPFPNYRFPPYLSMGRSYPISKSVRNNLAISNGVSARWREQHRLRFSGWVQRDQVNSFWPQYPAGSFQFGSGLTSLPGIVNTGHAFASFLLGGAEFAEATIVGSPSYFRRTLMQFALRDQWDLKKNLNFSLGVNLDVATPRVEKYNRQSTVCFDAINPLNGRPGALIFAAQDGNGRAFQPTNVRAEPSASLAWNPRGRQNTLIRLSYSRSYSPVPLYLGQWGTQGFNGVPTFVSLNPQLEPALWLRNGMPPPPRPLPDLRPDAVNFTNADLIEPTGRQPTYNSFYASVERQLPGAAVVTLGFRHSNGRNLFVGNSGAHPNAVHLDDLRFRDLLNDETFNRSRRPFPQYQRFDVYSSWPLGRYKRDSGYVRVEKRATGGLTLTAYYEVSKQMDDYSGPYGVQDYFNRSNEWSLTAGNNPQRFSLSYMYELPFGPNKPFLAATDWRRFFVEGWSLSGMTTLVSGEPIALRPQFNNTGGVVDALNVNVVPGVSPHVRNRGPELWFNPAAFEHPADFTIGNASRTHPSLRNPINQNHDLSINKRFNVTPEQSVELSAVGFNFINHANWMEPDPVIGPPGAPNVNAGRIIGSRGGRIIQIGLRYSF
jgi:hypothetical protein